jgi:hypothetical protein
MRAEKKLQALLKNRSQALAGLIYKANQLSQIEASFKKHLDRALADHCHVANLRSDCLILAVDSPAWVTRLRYAIPDLLKKLEYSLDLNMAQKIEWLVQPISQQNMKPPKKTPILSIENAALLLETASLSSIPTLKKALEHLATHK